MNKKILIGILLLLVVITSYLYGKTDKLTSSEVVEITRQHPAVKEWMKKISQNHRQKNQSYVNLSNIDSLQSTPSVKSKFTREFNTWTVSLESKNRINHTFLNVTIDDKSGEVIDVSEEERVIVVFKNEVNKKTIENANGEIEHVLNEAPVATVTVPSEEIEKLKDNPNILTVEGDQLIKINEQSKDWGIEKIQSNVAWNYGFTGKGVKVAVVDSGIDTKHEDLSIAGGACFVSYTNSYHDDNGHGTHVAGVIGALNNGVGTKGIAYDSSIYAVKVLDSTGSGYLSDIVKGIDWAITNNMDIINLSLGTESHSLAIKSVVDKAFQNGILVVASAGNSGSLTATDTVNYPAKYESVIAVGAVDSNLNITDFSSSGNALESTAPGLGILSTYLNNTYKKMSGTSMAAPYVTGNLALLMESNPNANAAELRKILQNNVIDLGDLGRDPLYGYGFIQSSFSYSIHGRNRYETSVLISNEGWPEGSSSIVLGRGDNPIDALTGSVLATKLNSPLLLTEKNKIPNEILNEIKRLNSKNVIILGGEDAISNTVKIAIENLGLSVRRISGTTRYETAVKIANEILSSNETFLTTGTLSPDPLSIAPYAGLISAPILLSNKDRLPIELVDFIRKNEIKKVTIIGGETVISPKVVEALYTLGVTQIERISGEDRYSTSAAIVKRYKNMFKGPVYVSSGSSFIDALSGAPLAAKHYSPIILIHRDFVPLSIVELIEQTYVQRPQYQFLGGSSVISIGTRGRLEAIIPYYNFHH